MLTAVHLLLRFSGTSFQIYLSSRIGAAGIGLLQLTMSVGNFAMVAGMAGIRTASMYLTAEELGKHRAEKIPAVISGCIRYSLLISGTIAVCLLVLSPEIAGTLIGDRRIKDSLRLFAGFLPICCINGVLTGCFTAGGQIRCLAIVEVAEQLFSMAATVLLLLHYAGSDSSRACQSVIAGSGAGACLTLVCLLVLHLRQYGTSNVRLPMCRRLTGTAVPLAAADLLKTGISTAENLMVPRRLSLHSHTAQPLAAFGILSGMVFPVLMFPACILFALADLLIPELAQSAAAGNRPRVFYLVKRGLKVSSLYGVFFGGLLFLVSEELCTHLYSDPDVGFWLRRYAIMIPMLYCDLAVDAMTKGLGQQKLCVLFNIISSGLDVILLYILLPRYGMAGYYISFLLTHMLNFALSMATLLRITEWKLPAENCILGGISACLSVCLAAAAASICVRILGYAALLGSSLILLGVIDREDLSWLLRLAGVEAKETLSRKI